MTFAPKTAKQQSKENAFFSAPFIQRKLTVNEPGDAYEQEADALADKVMRMSDPLASSPISKVSISSLQRKCATCEEEDTMQRKETSNTGGRLTAPPIVSDVLSGRGKPLDKNVQRFMESSMGQDFSHVRIHAEGKAAESAQSVNALAYTSGHNIVFNNGQYQPDTEGGKRLLAHELVHTVQQGNGEVMRSPFEESDCNDYLYWSLKPLRSSTHFTGAALLTECPAFEKVTESNLIPYIKENGAEVTRKRILGSHEFKGTDVMRRKWADFVLKPIDKPSSDKTASKTIVALLTWEEKLDGFNHQSSSLDAIQIFYKDLLEQEIREIFGNVELVDVRPRGDTNCNPANLTLMLEDGDTKSGDYVAPDPEKEKKAEEARLSVDLGRSKDVNSIDDPQILCRRVFLNDIVKNNPQKFHATYFHENIHDEHRRLYIKHFKLWKKTFEKSKQPKGFITWIREKLASKSAIDLALIEEDHSGTTGTSFTESMAHLKTLEWQAKQKSTTEEAIKTRFQFFGDYASNIVGNVKPVINEFVQVYKSLPGFKKTISEVIKSKVNSAGRESVFYSKLSDAIKGL